nr:type ISP restriction/modification enzyme [Armatimonas sp.]
MKLLSVYLSELRAIRATGAAVAETSFYPALVNLLNEVGGTLKPKVRCHSHVSNTGAGIPDAGLFVSEQFAKQEHNTPLPNAKPERGVIEIKGVRADLETLARSEQVAKYLAHYGVVLVTNYRAFQVVEKGLGGEAVLGEHFELADSEGAFWQKAGSAVLITDGEEARFVEFLRRALSTCVTLTLPSEVAWYLASFAREAKFRIEAGDSSGLEPLKKTFQEALGLAFEGEKGVRFFRSTLVQTLFYGIFSAWVLWHREEGRHEGARFDWHMAAYKLHVPIVRDLFYQVANPAHLDALGLGTVLERAAATLNRVDRKEFFERFAADNAVQYFYEPFLEAFDPELRRELGVWYTPREIVAYQVARVDAVLKSELGIERGLADESVFILDPCCGTGAYLVEVVKFLHKSLGGDALAAAELKKSVLPRLFGFEILPAPFVVAHLQLGLLLQSLGAGLSASNNERMGVYLTNALTGWEPGGLHPALSIPGFAEERDAAERVKQQKPILVILGNPPYNGYAGVAVEEERSLSNAYRTVKNVPAPQGQGLNDLYIRFFRMAEKRIVETGGQGVVCYISNYSWLEGLSFTGMRERYAEVFDTIWVDNLHGDRIISEYAPDGRTSETVFAMQGSSVGIKVGTSITLMVKRPDSSTEPTEKTATIYYKDWDDARAAERRQALLNSVASEDHQKQYTALTLIPKLGLPFKPREMAAGYLEWKKLPELFPTSFPGVKTSRDDVLVEIDLERLKSRMESYFDPTISDETMRTISPGSMSGSGSFNATETRKQLQALGIEKCKFVKYLYRPFDVRYLFWEGKTKLLDRSRSDYFSHITGNNQFIVVTQRPRKNYYAPSISTTLVDMVIADPAASAFPIRLKATSLENDRLEDGTRYNFSDFARTYLQTLDASPDDLFYHTLAVLHSPTYRTENAGALRQDWPRVPLPSTKNTLEQSAALGRRVAALLDPEQRVSGVTTAPLETHFATLAMMATTDGTHLNPESGDLELTAGWGHGTVVVMPGKGRSIAREYDAGERQPFTDEQRALLGQKTYDIYLNDRAYWRNVPANVWAYTLGGYTVLKKWLSYREKGILQRGLTVEEARYVSTMVRRIAALLLLTPELDRNYGEAYPLTPAWRGDNKE